MFSAGSVVQVIGAMAELERSLIVERVRARPKECEGQGKAPRSPARDG
jgi:DNA invertase Pin-like site-specific DNA recombinase